MCKGMAKEVRMKQKNVVPVMMLQPSATVANGHLSDKWHDPETEAGGRLEAWDDLTGLSLDPRGVLETRQNELDYIEKKKVWGIVSRDKARANGWNVIKSRWLDVNKEDDVSVSYRSRSVGKEFADKRVVGLFAGTPPLEALRFLVHEAATVVESGTGGVGSQEESHYD